jgi:hypothetical protein
MFKNIIEVHKKLNNNAGAYYNLSSSEDPTYFGFITVMSVICGVILFVSGLVNILSTEGMTNPIKYVMLGTGILTIVFGIGYMAIADKIINYNYNQNDVILLQIFVYMASIFSGFISIVLAFCIVFDIFKALIYDIPLKILNYITNTEKKDTVKTLTNKFINYQARNY